MKHLVTLGIIYFFGTTNANRIAGGSITSVDSYPFATSLLSNLGDGAFRQACGGTILTTNAILSAASCFHTNQVVHPASWWRVRVGSTTANSGSVIYIIRLITPHPDFQAVTLNNDIAVLRTTLTMTFVPNAVQAAHLPGAAYSMNNNEVVWAIGWGATSNLGTSSEELRHVQIWIIDQQICAERYGAIGFQVTSTMLCAGWLDVGVRGQCQGDTGSPLLHNGVVVGVYSWTEGCGLGNYPNINTRVSSFVNWIVSTARA